MTLEKKRSLSLESSDEVRVIGIAEYEPAAQCLSEAFEVDEVARYFVDTDDMAAYSEEYKWKLHCDIIRYITAAHCYKGVVTTIGPDYDAVALWYVSSPHNIHLEWSTNCAIGFRLESPPTASGPCFVAVFGDSTTSSRPKARSASSTSSSLSCTTPSTT
jgi:hypothetical protein